MTRQNRALRLVEWKSNLVYKKTSLNYKKITIYALVENYIKDAIFEEITSSFIMLKILFKNEC